MDPKDVGVTESAIVLTASNDCGSDSERLNLGILEAPSADFILPTSPLLPGEPLVFKAPNGVNAVYQWIFPDGDYEGDSVTYIFDEAGSYEITLVTSNNENCSEVITKTIVIDDQTNILEKKNSDKFQVYPNPASSTLQVVLPNSTTSITITDVLGRTKYIQEQIPHKSDSNQIEIDLRMMQLENGIYFLKIMVEGQARIKRFVVQKN